MTVALDVKVTVLIMTTETKPETEVFLNKPTITDHTLGP